EVAELLLPRAALARQGNPLGRPPHHGVEQLVLVPEVAVDAHGPHVELLCEPAHAEGVEALALHHVHGGFEDPLPRELLSGGGVVRRLPLARCHPHVCTVYTTPYTAREGGDAGTSSKDVLA